MGAARNCAFTLSRDGTTLKDAENAPEREDSALQAGEDEDKPIAFAASEKAAGEDDTDGKGDPGQEQAVPIPAKIQPTKGGGSSPGLFANERGAKTMASPSAT